MLTYNIGLYVRGTCVTRRILQCLGARSTAYQVAYTSSWWVLTKLKQKYGVTLGITAAVHGLFEDGLLIKATQNIQIFRDSLLIS